MGAPRRALAKRLLVHIEDAGGAGGYSWVFVAFERLLVAGTIEMFGPIQDCGPGGSPFEPGRLYQTFQWFSLVS